MNEQNDNRRLLSDILGEGNDAGFRESLLLQTLSLAQRRRRVRQVRRAASALVLMACVAFLFWRGTSPKPVSLPLHRAPLPYTLIRTRPLPASALVRTEPLPAEHVIASIPTENIVSTIATENIVSTMAAHPGYREIDDRQLFSLAPAPIVLIRHSSNESEVVFADPADQETFLRN